MIRFVGTAQHGKDSLLYFSQLRKGYSIFNMVRSTDGLEFGNTFEYVSVRDSKKEEEKNYDWRSFRIAKQGTQFFLTYKVNSKGSTSLYGAMSEDLVRFEKIGKIAEIKETGAVVPDFKYRDHHVMYYGEKSIRLAYSNFLYHWKSSSPIVLESRPEYFDDSDIEVGNAFLTKDGILLTYYVKSNSDGNTKYMVGAVIFDKDDPSAVLWRADSPLWEQGEELADESIKPMGSVILNNELVFYWMIGNDSVFAVPSPIPNMDTGISTSHFSAHIKKHDQNPIIAPRIDKPWESRATFNTAAVYDDGKVHFLYRALGDKDLSVLGYATSSDGVNIDHRSDEPIYVPREPFETPGNNAFKTFAEHFASGGGYGGVEDPRITKVEDKFYLTYVAFDGANPPRAAMSSIKIKDFHEKNWSKWAAPKLISAPGLVNKSAVIFPKKVNGKYVVLHRVYPNILVDYLDDLEFNDYLQGHHFIPPRKKFWDSKKVGAGAPPMETKDGWLLIYQSVGYQDPGRYKIGAMMLDKNNPSKVLYRTHTPIIEPKEAYENDGKAGVVYPCGAVIMDNKLNVYYGGGDTVVCAATADVDKFLFEMKRNKEPKLKKVRSSLFA